MEYVLKVPKKKKKQYYVLVGHFIEIQNFISKLETKLEKRLLYAEIEAGAALDNETDEEDEELRATIHIWVRDGTELAEFKNLHSTPAYRSITIEQTGSIETNDDGDRIRT
jgi:hypothetical protein